MAYQSRRARAERANRLLTDRHVDLCLLVRDHLGADVIQVGGRWDKIAKRYVGPCAPRVVTLQESQQEAGQQIAAYIRARLAGNPHRIALHMAIGNRGGGKTFVGALLLILLALALPGCWQIAVNITSKQKRDVLGAIKKIIGARSNPTTGALLPGGWLSVDNTDMRDPSTVLACQSTILWASSKNPDALRTAEISFENIFINEAQSQPVEVFNNAAGAIRNTGGIVSIATNPPQRARGNFIAKLYQAIESQPEDEPRKGDATIIVNSGNAAIDQPTLPKIRWMLLAADRRAAAADADGVIKVAGDLGYPDFKALPLHRGGHLIDELGLRRIRADWLDVTREETERVAGSPFDFIAGADFQKNPGSCATIGKLYRTPAGALVRIVLDVVATEGTNTDLSQGFVSAGYVPGMVDRDGRPAPGRRLLIVGDATGKHQGPAHDFDGREMFSFIEIRQQGWTLIPPDHHWQSGIPRNPFVDESRRQMQAVFLGAAILLGPACDVDHGGFPSVVDSFANTLVNSAGKFVKKEHFTHMADCERYVCWAFLPRPQADPVDQTIDANVFHLLRGIEPSFRT